MIGGVLSETDFGSTAFPNPRHLFHQIPLEKNRGNPLRQSLAQTPCQFNDDLSIRPPDLSSCRAAVGTRVEQL